MSSHHHGDDILVCKRSCDYQSLQRHTSVHSLHFGQYKHLPPFPETLHKQNTVTNLFKNQGTRTERTDFLYVNNVVRLAGETGLFVVSSADGVG